MLQHSHELCSCVVLFLLVAQIAQSFRMLPAQRTPRISMRSDLNDAVAASAVGRRELVLSSAAALIGSTILRPSSAAAADDSAQGYDLSLERIYDTRVKSYLPATPERLFRKDNLPDAQVICIGEHHTHSLDHRAQFRSIAALHRAAPEEPLAIGLEMFYKTHQPALNRYVFEHGNLAQLARETDWQKTWGYDLSNYAKIFRYAHLHKLPLVGLNVPRAVVTLVRTRGVAELPPALRAALPELDLSNAAHYARFRENMKGLEAYHGPMSAAVLARFYEAQTLWEESMAANAVAHLARHKGRMAVLAGVAHLAHRDGLPDRIAKRMGGAAPFTIVPESVAWDKHGLPEIDVPPQAQYADWVWYTEQELPPVSKARTRQTV